MNEQKRTGLLLNIDGSAFDGTTTYESIYNQEANLTLNKNYFFIDFDDIELDLQIRNITKIDMPIPSYIQIENLIDFFQNIYYILIYTSNYTKAQHGLKYSFRDNLMNKFPSSLQYPDIQFLPALKIIPLIKDLSALHCYLFADDTLNINSGTISIDSIKNRSDNLLPFNQPRFQDMQPSISKIFNSYNYYLSFINNEITNKINIYNDLQLSKRLNQKKFILNNTQLTARIIIEIYILDIIKQLHQSYKLNQLNILSEERKFIFTQLNQHLTIPHPSDTSASIKEYYDELSQIYFNALNREIALKYLYEIDAHIQATSNWRIRAQYINEYNKIINNSNTNNNTSAAQ